jgi:hypothetical protein
LRLFLMSDLLMQQAAARDSLSNLAASLNAG